VNVLIVGAAGQLGRELQETAPVENRVTALDLAELDITDADAVSDCLRRSSPDVVINAAGYTAVDRAESEPDRARQINSYGVAHLARAAAKKNSRMIHVSTDYVFDGSRTSPYRPDDKPGPINIYGRSKLEGERNVVSTLGPRALVLRSAWLYSRYGTNFVLTMLRLMRECDEVRVVNDQIGSPTWARGLAQVIWIAAARAELSGIYHWTDAGIASWYDFATAIQDEALALGLLERRIPLIAIRSDEYAAPARRPAYSVLDTSATCQALAVRQKDWREMLRRMLGDLV